MWVALSLPGHWIVAANGASQTRIDHNLLSSTVIGSNISRPFWLHPCSDFRVFEWVTRRPCRLARGK